MLPVSGAIYDLKKGMNGKRAWRNALNQATSIMGLFIT